MAANDLKLGQILTTEEGRDAIHIAIAPVTAICNLDPGQHISLINDNEHAGAGNNPVGVVDPFLTREVIAGQRFWMFLYPNTITSLRHEWTHPAFKRVSGVSQREKDREFSEEWLRRYAARVNCYLDSDAAFCRLIENLRTNDLEFQGTDLHGLFELPDADELKRHAEKYLDIKIEWGTFTFSCSC